MPRSIVIVHGWSDDSKSFRRLAEQLEAWFGSAPTQIRLADWISLQDDVTYADLAAALDRAWTAQGLSRAPARWTWWCTAPAPWCCATG